MSQFCLKFRDFFTNYLSYCSIRSRISTFEKVGKCMALLVVLVKLLTLLPFLNCLIMNELSIEFDKLK